MTKVIKKAWSPNEDNTLKTMVNEGNTSRVIAKVLGRTENSIFNRRHKLRLQSVSKVNTRRKETSQNLSKHGAIWTPEEDSLIVSLFKEGRTSREISEILERTPVSVDTRKHFLGLNKNSISIGKSNPSKLTKGKVIKKSAWSENDDTLLSLMLQEGKSAKEIAKVLGRTPGAVSNRKYTANISSTPSGTRRENLGTRRTRWTENDEEMLKILVEEGKSPKEIAEYMSRTINAVRTRMSIRNLYVAPKKVAILPKEVLQPDSTTRIEEILPQKESGIKTAISPSEINATIKVKNTKMLKKLIRAVKEAGMTLNIIIE